MTEKTTAIKTMFVRSINAKATEVYNNNKEKGFWWEGEKRDKGKLIALMHSELSKALEAIRYDEKGGPLTMDKHIPHRRSVEVEMADAVIRIMDFCGAFGHDLGGAIEDKVKFNKTRPHKHGRAF